jgi:molybdopterin-guanine dinucleotide biosynthesis adapter protein
VIPVISFIGHSGIGKTTYLEKLIVEMKRRGYRVGVVKHDIHGFEMDQPGKDTWRHTQAGAEVVCISSAKKFALLKNLHQDMPLAELISYIKDVDIIFIEGYKNHSAHRVEIFRQAAGLKPLDRPEDLFAVITDVPLYPKLPHFSLETPTDFADYLEYQLRSNKP